MIPLKQFPIIPESSLRMVSRPVTTKEFATRLKELILAQFPTTGALAVAAPQIGILKRASVIQLPSTKEFLFICNPEIVEQEEEFIFHGEGCLSFPKKHKDTVRYNQVKVKYFDENLEERTIVAEGLEAVIFQHEIGHLNGDLFFDHVRKPITVEKLPGRNEPCTCGSGKKFKKCHGG